MVNIRLGEEYQCDAITNRVPNGAKLEWFSKAPDVVSVDENGLCRGLKLGSSSVISASAMRAASFWRLAWASAVQAICISAVFILENNMLSGIFPLY